MVTNSYYYLITKIRIFSTLLSYFMDRIKKIMSFRTFLSHIEIYRGGKVMMKISISIGIR